MNLRASWGRNVVEHQETAFSLCMGLVAVLGRGNPILEYPQILWLFAGLLLFNLLYHMWLKRPGTHWLVPLASIAANLVWVSAILKYSGGAQSQFWPMYLLPIFTACIYLKTWHIVFTVLACAGFLSCFYLEPLWQGLPWDRLELLIKFAVLGLSAGITSRVSFKEREARVGLERSRGELDRLTKSLLNEERAAPGSRAGAEQWLRAMLHSMSNGLMVISGTSEILMVQAEESNADSREDLHRIHSAAQALGALTTSLSSFVRKDSAVQPVALDKVIPPAVQLLDFKIKLKGLRVSKNIPADLPPVKWNSVVLQRAFATLLSYVIDQASPEGRLDIKAAENRGLVEVLLEFSAGKKATFRTGFEAAKNIFALQDGVVAEKRGEDLGEITVSLPRHSGKS